MAHKEKGVPSYGAPTAKDQPLGPFEAGAFEQLGRESGGLLPETEGEGRSEADAALGEFARARSTTRLSSVEKQGKASIPSEGTPNPPNPSVG